MVNLSHSKLKRKGHTEEKYVPASKISRKQIEKLAPEKIASARTQMLLRLKWIKAKKSETEPSGTGRSPYTAMNTALFLKK